MSEWLEAPHGFRLVAMVLGALGVVGVSGLLYQLTNVIGAVMTIAGAVLIVWILYAVVGASGEKEKTLTSATVEQAE